jgi:ribonuclease Z
MPASPKANEEGRNIMEDTKEKEPTGLTRREAIKISGLALGGLAIGGALTGSETGKAQTADSCACDCYPDVEYNWTESRSQTQRYSYFQNLPTFQPFDSSKESTTKIAPLSANEMRITFMGSGFPPPRRAQQMMSVFVEVGWNDETQMPLDQFVFDCGSGVVSNYGAMNVGFSRMDKVFIAHLHSDHMSDLSHIYCFGPSIDRKSPLYVWGPSRSNFAWTDPNGTPWPQYKDGTADYCLALRQAMRWHTESFSFQTTSYPTYKDPIANGTWIVPKTLSNNPQLPSPVVDTDVSGNPIPDPYNDAYAIVPIELDWTLVGGLAYKNTTTGVIITHFPVIHTRRGSIGYKLEWWPSPSDTGDETKNHLTMIYTSDTKPEYNCVNQAINGGKGVDVLIHEMIVPAQVYTMKSAYSDDINAFPVDSASVQQLATIQASSHSPQGGFGYLLSQINPAPRLTVATHFPVANDTVACAMKSVQEHFPKAVVYQGNQAPHPTHSQPDNPVRITWSLDLMVINVSKDKIVEQQAVVTDLAWPPWVNYPVPQANMNPPKYWQYGGAKAGQEVSDPYAQIDTTTQIPACNCNTGPCNYNDDGY